MRLTVIDFLKGYSITTIVLLHLFQKFNLPSLLAKAIDFGGGGVHVFILCSGFGLYLSHLNRPLDYFTFLKKRFSKIYFPYILIVLISSAFPFMYDSNDRVLALLSHIFLFKMFFQKYINSFGVQFWFISMILQFYLFFPVILRFFKLKNPIKEIIISLIISLTWAVTISLIGKTDIRVWNSFFLQYLWEFVLGMSLANYYFLHGDLILPKMWQIILLSIICIGITGYTGLLGGIYKVLNDVPSLLGYLSFALIIYSLHVKYINRFFVFTSNFSYEWYLVHMLIFNCTFIILGSFSLIKFGMAMLILSYICAFIYGFFVKKYLFSRLEFSKHYFNKMFVKKP